MMFKNLSPSALGISGHQCELIELALTYGFSGLELNIVEFASRAKLKGMPYARRLIDSAKIRIGFFPLPVDLGSDAEQFGKSLAKLPECAEAAAAIGCQCCTALIAPGGDSRPYHENFELHRQRLSDVCKALAPAGVRLGVGFLAAESARKNLAFEFIHDLDALMTLVNMVDAPNLGVRLDAWEVFAAGGDLSAIEKLPASKIVAVQVAELPGDVAAAELNDTHRLLPGDSRGRIDLSAVLAALGRMGYDGPVTPRVARAAFSSRKRDLVVRQAGEALERVWEAAGLPADGSRFAAAAEQE